jgi:hypothetical protein
MRAWRPYFYTYLVSIDIIDLILYIPCLNGKISQTELSRAIFLKNIRVGIIVKVYHFLACGVPSGLMARRLSTKQEIAGSIPARGGSAASLRRAKPVQFRLFFYVYTLYQVLIVSLNFFVHVFHQRHPQLLTHSSQLSRLKSGFSVSCINFLNTQHNYNYREQCRGLINTTHN